MPAWKIIAIVFASMAIIIVSSLLLHLGDNTIVPALIGSLTGHQNLKETRIALVEPTFTGAAYNNSFYLFYAKYEYLKRDVPVYNDLSMLNGKMSAHPANNQDLFDWIFPLKNHTSNLLPNSDISLIEDQDINNGIIFDPRGNNAYDVLVIGHEEYATQKMYENFKKFAYQGGVIIFMDGNIFYAEVSYNSENDTVTLVKGHSWEYNGIYAKRGVIERWFNETSSWVGSNYYVDGYRPIENKPGNFKYQYQNDPFGYGPVRNEDQYVTNSDINVILDYKLTDPLHKVVTYWKPYGTGKVIVLGIYSEKVITKSSFLKFYDSLLLHYALEKN